MIPIISPTIKASDIFCSIFSSSKINPEEEFAKIFRKKNCYFVSEAREALHIILKQINLKKSDEIIVPAYICDIVPKVAGLSARVVYADIDKETFTLDFKDLKAKTTKKTKAVILAHMYGNVKNLKAISSYCKKRGITLIEDCAQSACSFENGIRAGSVGDYSFFSFRFSKDLSMLKGGAIVTDFEIKSCMNQEKKRKRKSAVSFIFILCIFIMLKLQRLFYGRAYHCIKKKIIVPYFEKTEFDSSVEKKLLSEFEKKLAIAGMNRMPKVAEKRAHNAKKLDECLKELKNVKICSTCESGLLKFNILAKNRDKLIEFLEKNGVESGSMFDYSMDNSCKNSVYVSKNIANLPINHKLSDDDLKKICLLIKNFCSLRKL